MWNPGRGVRASCICFHWLHCECGMQDVDISSLTQCRVCFQLDMRIFVASPASLRNGIRQLRGLSGRRLAIMLVDWGGVKTFCICRVGWVLLLNRATTESVQELQNCPGFLESRSFPSPRWDSWRERRAIMNSCVCRVRWIARSTQKPHICDSSSNQEASLLGGMAISNSFPSLLGPRGGRVFCPELRASRPSCLWFVIFQ